MLEMNKVSFFHISLLEKHSKKNPNRQDFRKYKAFTS
jgi:hypothetical protein